MKSISAMTALGVLAAGAALAGNPVPVPTPAGPVAPMSAAAPSWDGFYAGGMVGFNSGDNDYFDDGCGEDECIFTLTGTSFGAFAGYNTSAGALVFGGEVAVAFGDVRETDFATYTFDYVLDLKGRVGFAAGSALVYGVVGWSMAPFDAAGDTGTLSGLNYGAGVDMMVSDRMFVGAEYLIRDMSGDFDDGDFLIESSLSTLNVRVGFRF